jgi:hypothetical protein
VYGVLCMAGAALTADRDGALPTTATLASEAATTTKALRQATGRFII